MKGAKMEYKTLKNLGKGIAITAIAAIPYVCDTCGYNGSTADACTRRPKPTKPAPKPDVNLETKLVYE